MSTVQQKLSFKYIPDEDTKIHEVGAIRLICKGFQSHESGLPEWLKNAADEYIRLGTPESQRVVVVIFDSGRKNYQPSISCLDLCGMTSSVIENNFRIWADPEAAKQGQDSNKIQGGHGNGGKCYMTHSLIVMRRFAPSRKGKGTIMVFLEEVFTLDISQIKRMGGTLKWVIRPNT